MSKSWRAGGCHCGKVKWRALTPDKAEAERCNCSICSMTGFIHLIIPAKDFELLSGALALTEYRFNKKIAVHKFCSHCGVKSFYIPRSNPEGISLNVNCMDKDSFEALKIVDFDGVNWEQNAASLAHKSN
jgi:hypothetical protein